MGDNPYLEWTTYQGRTGALVEVTPEPCQRWQIRFSTTSLVWSDFKSKIGALIFAAHKCGLSGQAMDWRPR